jgi:hypothetical protein
MKNLKTILGVFLITIFFASCDSNDSLPQLQGAGNIFVRCMKDGETTKYAPVMYAASNYAISKATVTGPTNSDLTYSLSKYFEGSAAFRKTPTAANFSTDDLPNGTYKFTIISADQETVVVEDKLLDTRLAPVEIETFTYDPQLHSFEIDWKDIDGADVYAVKIQEEVDGKHIFISETLSKSEFNFSMATRGWTTFNKVEGKTYSIGVYAYKYENPNVKSGSEINCESVEFRDITW